MQERTRKILHVDMDAFYASVEILDHPELQGLPVVVGGSPKSRGVVCAASYEARTFGVHSAMACSRAYRLCPQAIFVKPRFPRYREISRQIHDIFQQYTDQIEALALDEAWLDVTENFVGITSGTILARRIKTQIKKELGLTCSVGVSFNKFLAKIASDEDKPDGLFVITPADAHEFLMHMAVRKIPGVGKVMQKHLAKLGIRYGHELYDQSEAYLAEHFGKMGHYLYRRIRGHDDRPVVTHRDPKSISNETTFSEDLLFGDTLVEALEKLSEHVAQRLRKHTLQGKTLTLKVKFFDFQQITRATTRDQVFGDGEAIFGFAREKLRHVCEVEFPGKRIRLIGVGISNFDTEMHSRRGVQLDLFPLV